MRPLYIFDLDGTLALIQHRLHFIQSKPKDWRGFFAAVKDNVPNVPVIKTMIGLRTAGCEIWVWSGRSDECKEETKEWLSRYCRMNFNNWFLPPETLRMRKAGDYRDDVVVKSEWLAEIEPPEYDRLTAVFDDRDRVVKMWRDAGVPCFQVAPGEF